MWSRWWATGKILNVGTTPAADSGSQPSIDLFDRAGKKLRAVDGDRAAWLLDDALLVTNRDSGRIESLDGTAVALPGSFGKDVLPGRDVVAVPVAGARFEVRGSDGVIATGDGIPVAWSPDGARLAVFRPSRTGPGTSASVAGVLEVRTWPGLAKVGPDVAASRVTPAFDASGAHLAFADPTESRIGIFDLASGKVTANVDGLPSFAWTGATLHVVSGDGSVLTVETTGRSSPSGMTGDTIVGTTLANDLLVFTANEASPITLVTEAGPRLVEAPGRVGLKSTIGGNGLVALVLMTETGEELRLSRD
jgi:hypothetical protein